MTSAGVGTGVGVVVGTEVTGVGVSEGVEIHPADRIMALRTMSVPRIYQIFFNNLFIAKSSSRKCMKKSFIYPVIILVIIAIVLSSGCINNNHNFLYYMLPQKNKIG